MAENLGEASVDITANLKPLSKALGEARSRVRKAGEKMQSIGQNMKGFGSTMSASVTGPILAGFGLVTKGTEELQQGLSRLETNAQNAGLSTDEMRNAMVRLSTVSSDANASVEALSNLMATGFDQEGLTAAVDALSGAVIKFPDTLNIEGLADGLQETVATGKAVGPFAELLERLGINLEEFDRGLQKAKASGQAQQYVLETLADSGLAKVNKQYRENNKELVKSQESQQRFQNALADLGETLAPVLSKITEFATKLVEWFNNLSPASQTFILAIVGIMAIIGPLIVIIGSLIASLGALAVAEWAVIGPIILIGIAIMAVIAIIILLTVYIVQNWDKIKAKTLAVWNMIKAFFATVWEGIKSTFRTAVDTVKNAVSTAWDWIKKVTSNIWNGIKNTISSVWNGIKNAFQTAVDTVSNAVSKAWNWIKSTTRSVWDWISSKISSVWNGISSTASRVWSGIYGTIRSTINSIIRVINGMIRGINNISFTAPDWVPGIGGKGWSPSIPTIPYLAEGGIVTAPTLAMVGEGRDDEAVVPLNRRTLGDLASGIAEHLGGGGTTINMYGLTVREDADIDRIAEAIERKRQREARLGV